MFNVEWAIFKTRIRRMRRTWRTRLMHRIWWIRRTQWILRIRRIQQIRRIKGFSVSFTLILKVLYLLVSYPVSYTWLTGEP